jgi:hypothetical protein
MKKISMNTFMVILITAIVTMALTSTGIVEAAKQSIFNFSWTNLKFASVTTTTSWGNRIYSVDRHYDSEF